MAAKPPKPPATLLKQKSPINSEKSANGNNDSTVAAATTPTTPTSAAGNSPIDDTFSKLGIRRYNSRDNLLNNISNDNNTSDINGIGGAAGATGSSGGATARAACNCTNISIMHLFHEMKQEFPTIPDPIVAQCVNANCHQRENCIQVLRNELALNPIPVQTYPAKVLQQHHINQQHNSQQQQQSTCCPKLEKRSQSLTPSHPQPPQRHKNAPITKPSKLLRPIRTAPTQPPFATLQRLRSDTKSCAVVAQPANCDSEELVQDNTSKNNNYNTINNNSNLLKNVFSVQSPVCNNHTNSNSIGESSTETCDMPALVNAKVTADSTHSNDFKAALTKVTSIPPTEFLTVTRSRPRPNTLDLHTAQQQLQRQQLNKQLHHHLQQRNQLQQQLVTDLTADTPHQQQKPIRKAPLPPIAPKPVFHNNTSNNQNQYNYNNNNSCGNSPQSQSGGSCSAESNVTSPISSCGESEISANIGLPSQNFSHAHINNNTNNNTNNNNQNATTTVAPNYQNSQQSMSPIKSPIRHRSVITVQPEPPYTRDFIPPSKNNTGVIATPSNIGGSGNSTPTSQKSFTSVNLTLRQPTTTVPQSTIDISAGPASSGYGSGLTYSSTSFDARRGYQQNFHITVTDEGGVFNASRIRPRNNSGYYSSIEERDNPAAPTGGVRQTTSSRTQQQQPPTSTQTACTLGQNITQQAIQSITSPTREEMCVPFENSALAETIRRQKTRRDKLATALRENKQKLGHVEEEINMLTETLSPGESERLDYEIERLRSDCQLMLNEIENIRRYGQVSDVERLQLQHQQQQPFPRQRPPRPLTQQPPQSPYSYQQPDLASLQQHQQQHHTAGSNVCNSQNITAVTPNTTYLPQSTNAYQQRQNNFSNQQTQSTDEEDYSDSNSDGGDADNDEPLECWPCSMCTFLNHPQLNICEACECVRILPEPMLSRENIHITLSPGENRIVHSWVVS
ncbi:putative uncharacterized protein DDB_G0288537 isoform X2 [Eurosta solidaginis]|uniref:putative uncharacterized protein DDB_G0288537 isoform X2 n=1 Tax=Eurosta solidaginis TaxID=178769 RepID=UPI0035315897